MTSSINPKEIVITGDIALDWHIVNLLDKHNTFSWNGALPSRICWQFGGVLLLSDLVEEIIKIQNSIDTPWTLHRVKVPKDGIDPDDDRFTNTYASWEITPKTNSDEDRKKPKIWRVKEFLGVSHATTSPNIKLESDNAEMDIVELDDADLGFRKCREQWPLAITHPSKTKKPWIVIKMAKPITQGELWNELYERWAERLIVILSVKDLRLSEVQISNELSWERTAQDVAWELVYNPRVNAISNCAHVIVSFGAAGAIWVKKTNKPLNQSHADIVPPQCTLFFDPDAIEGTWEQSHPGKMIGYNTCLTASIIREIMHQYDQPDIARGIKTGLCTLRKLHDEGFEFIGSQSSRGQIVFPYHGIAQSMETCTGEPFASAEIQFPTRLLETSLPSSTEKPVSSGMWMILQQAATNDMEALAENILRFGAELALKNVPLGKFGNLLTVDRREIESFRSIRRLANEYCSQEKTKRPLSIAVFGPPGAGKSFGITQVSKSLRPDEIKEITFNLSQFGSTADLIDAFHQVRDLNLTGKIPLVFWDEFDSVFESQKFGWLRYFLVPMQDGIFMEGQLSHPLGRAIFVFAGGICHSVEEFFHEAEDVREAKGPDFISRLRGYVNIMGANPPDNTNNGMSDPFYLVRRAILLRSILWQNAPQIFQDHNSKGILNIDSSVLNALLMTRQYKHGARSMEAIINMSNLSGKSHFDQSSLPPENQLNLHVNGQDFLAWVQEIILEGETLEHLAALNHTIYCEAMRADGYSYGETRDNQNKTRPLLTDYDQIPEIYKQSNRNVVRSIANKLKTIGYIMVQARSNEPPLDFPGPDLEKLAEMEHKRYLEDAIAEGWRYGPIFDEVNHLNPTLLPWEKMSEQEIQNRYSYMADKIGRETLSEEEKQKDRSQVERYPQILKRAGYAIVKIRG